ncbi:hypothetical protein Brms1b_009847 [Colletotrichum noveboracense]|nr:hypothetical protein Brms1b_009847 [Colletotrichum noveboracense]
MAPEYLVNRDGLMMQATKETRVTYNCHWCYYFSDGDGNRGEPQYEFSETQKWCKINSKRIRFIDETTDINSIHNDDYDSDEDIVSEEEPAPPSPPKANQRPIAAKSRDEEETLAFFDKPAEHYYAVALSLLSPVLIDPSAEVDDLHVTAAVLLRLYNSISVYEKLSTYAAQWMKAAPETFLPIFVENPPNEGVFPEILLINDSVVVGLQFYHLNRILLTAHNPNVPRLGKNLKLAAQTLDVGFLSFITYPDIGMLNFGALVQNEIINDIKIMCGIAESHGRGTPAHM